MNGIWVRILQIEHDSPQTARLRVDWLRRTLDRLPTE